MPNRMNVTEVEKAGRYVDGLARVAVANRQRKGPYNKTDDQVVFDELKDNGIDASAFDEIEFVYDEPNKMYIRIPAADALPDDAELSGTAEDYGFDDETATAYKQALCGGPATTTLMTKEQVFKIRLAEYTLNNCK